MLLRNFEDVTAQFFRMTLYNIGDIIAQFSFFSGGWFHGANLERPEKPPFPLPVCTPFIDIRDNTIKQNA
jgi:hypothetical protein